LKDVELLYHEKSYRVTGGAGGAMSEAFLSQPEGRLALLQNRPNPFSISTQISYDVPMTMSVTLRIYDISGGLVTTLVDEVQRPHHYRIDWNGKDSMGQAVRNGVYFCRIETGEYTATKKMVVVR
jgi:hypothetical protein